METEFLKKVQNWSLMMFSLNMVDYPMTFLLLSIWIILAGQVEGTILSKFYSLGLIVGPLLHA